MTTKKMTATSGMKVTVLPGAQHECLMTSREIAEVTGIRHDNVLLYIRRMEPAWKKVGLLRFEESNYINNQGKRQPMYKLTQLQCLYIATKFNDEARARLIIRWAELEKSARALSQPIGGVLPIFYNGAAGYPRKELLEAAGYSASSGTVSTLKKRYPKHFFTICRTACVSAEFAKMRLEQGENRQLEINFQAKKLKRIARHENRR